VLKLLLATNNHGKVKEYMTLLEGLPLELVIPGDMGIAAQVVETGATYAENARIKAVALAAESDLVSLADDSGLEVDALHGEPGIRSARYAGPGASDAERVNYLLGKLAGVPLEKRTARFVCVIAVASPGGKVEICTGECSGLITFAPKGGLGFGYDPVFYFPQLEKTMAELPMLVKNRVSHRGKAVRLVPDALRRLGFLQNN
jgi:XTP/dITP diphosphohydrolase